MSSSVAWTMSLLSKLDDPLFTTVEGRWSIVYRLVSFKKKGNAMFRKTECKRRGRLVILHLVRIAESLVTVLSLGYLWSTWYSDLLFSDWAEDD